INKSLNLHLSVPAFFQNPTISKLAAVLDEEGHQLQPGLMQLSPGRRGAGALFILDASIGLCRLAQHLECSGMAIFTTTIPLSRESLLAAAQGKTSATPTLQELAAAHTALILRQQTLGPCVLMGYSFGGLLAFEVARQLRRQGRQVEAVLLIDSWLRYPPWYKKLKILTFGRAKNSLKFHASHLWSITKAKISRLLTPGRASRNPPFVIPEGSSLLPGDVPWEIVEMIYRSAKSNYRLLSLDTRAILFRSQHNFVAHLYPIHPHLGWKGLFLSGLQIVEVPGDHYSLLKDPQVMVLAGRISESLKALATSSHKTPQGSAKETHPICTPVN
ncbi:MAG: thioesterase domain-containing protein, partial [Limisphaerales bacterium]